MKPLRNLARPRPVLRGLTLVELLVVIVVLTVITAATIPVALPAIEARRMREASRGVNTFIAGARYRALEIGRPVGVLFERVDGEPRAVRTLRYVEVPPPYTGLSQGAKVTLSKDLTDSTNTLFLAQFNEPFPERMVRVGDRLRVDYQGAYYRIVGGVDNVVEIADSGGFIVTATSGLPTLLVSVIPNGGVAPAISTAPNPLPFQIERQPISTSTSPYRLPKGTVIDLVGSGRGRNGTFAGDLAAADVPLIVTFNPDGTIARLYPDPAGLPEGGKVLDTLVFLVGKREFIFDFFAPEGDDMDKANWRQPNSYWIALSAATGNITTAENAVIRDPGIAALGGPEFQLRHDLEQARRFAFTTRPASGG